MNILVTGGCGFIGSHIVEHHLAKGDQVHVIDNLTTGSLENIANFKNIPGFKFFHADIITWPHLNIAVKWAERIYHMAAVIGVYRVIAEPLKVFSTNILGCDHLLNTIYKSESRPQVIIASSSSVYGKSQNSLLSETDDLVVESGMHPLSGYAISKIANEVLSLAYYYATRIPMTLIRLFNTIGPRQVSQYGMVVPRFIQQACHNRPITVYGDGTQTRSFCDVRDVLAGLELLTNNEKSNGQVVNVGNDFEISINDLAKLIRKKANSQSEIQHIPYHEAYGIDFIDVKQRRPDLTRFFELTNFKPQWSIEASIDNLISHYRDKEMK